MREREIGRDIPVGEMETYHVIARKKRLQKLSFFLLHGFQDEFIVRCQIEKASTGTGILQLA